MAMADGGRDHLDSLLDRQGRDWLAGRRPLVEELLSRSPLRDGPDAQLDLIYHEIVLRGERGEESPAAEYVRRYPHLREAIEQHLEVHRAVDGDLLSQTARLRALDTLPDATPAAAAGLPQPPDNDNVEQLGRGGMLDAEPEHFAARLFQALCALHQDRPGEAKVGLTACVAQRPLFAWTYVYRGRCAERLGDPAAAARDYDRAAALQPGLAAR
jgi:hypothetical protein